MLVKCFVVIPSLKYLECRGRAQDGQEGRQKVDRRRMGLASGLYEDFPHLQRLRGRLS